MKPKVVIILNRLVIGGQAVDTIPLAYYLKNNFDILVLYGQKEKDEVEALFLLEQYPNLTLKKIAPLKRTINPLIDVWAFFLILRQIKNFKAAVVHTHGSKSGLLGRLAAYMVRVPVRIHTFHGHLFHSYFNTAGTWLVKFIERKMAAITSVIIALSEEQKKELVEVFKIARKEKVEVIGLGVDDRNLLMHDDEKRISFRENFRLNSNAIAIGIIGRVVPIKNHMLFLKTAQQLLDEKYTNLYFFIVGDGESNNGLMDYLNTNHIAFSTNTNHNPSANIIFTSWMEDMASVYHGMDIVMLTSFNEGTPLSIIEAQFCGKPVIATNVGGVKDTFKAGVSGILLNSHSVSDCATALKQLINDATLRKSMGEKAFGFATNKFAKTHEVNAITDLYLQQLAKTNS